MGAVIPSCCDACVFTMFDTDKFIECVHDQPALWDKHLQEYSDRNEREKCWILVGEMMYSDWLEIDIKEKDARIKDLKNKWRHINQGKSGDAAPAKKKKYVYADALTFLLSSMEKRPTSGNISQGDEGTEGNLQEEQDGDTTMNSEIVDEVVRDTPLQPPIPATKGQKNRNNKMTPFQQQLLTKLNTSSTSEEDPDRLYILSLLSDYKKLNEDEKLDFKMTNIQFFQNARRQKAQQTAPPPSDQNLLTVLRPAHYHPTAGVTAPAPYQQQPFPLQPWNQPNFSMAGPSQQHSQNQFIPSNESSYSSGVSPNESVYSYNSEV